MKTAAEEVTGLMLYKGHVAAVNPVFVTASHDVLTCAQVIFVQNTPQTATGNGVG